MKIIFHLNVGFFSFSVTKYKRVVEDEGTLRGKLNKFNIHSIRKKGDRFAGYLKILTGVEPQVKYGGIKRV